MEKTIYRLGEYRITEYENGMLWWETHHGLGEQRSGKCFIHDDILILGVPRHEDIGFLKLEFTAKLHKLTSWNKTRYYCFASELSDVVSGRALNEDILDRMFSSADMNASPAKPVTANEPGAFRLGKYQITVAADSQISWQTCRGTNKLVGGQCIIKSDVLFIGPKEHENGQQNNREFLTKLKQLPQWDRTAIWSRTLALLSCEPPLQEYRPKTTSTRQSTWEDFACPARPAAAQKCSARRRLRDLLPSGLKLTPLSLPIPHKPVRNGLHRQAWRLHRKTKAWSISILSLVPVGLLLVLILSLHSVEKGLHWLRSSGKHRHKHKAR
jgi:hypothetical protein